MNDLVVGERKDEVLVPRVHHRERELVVVPAPVDRLVGRVVERVVHPAHVPLEGEAEAPPSSAGDARPRRRLLGRHRHARVRACTTSFSSGGTRPPRGPRDRRSGSAATRRARASSRGRASRRRRRPAGRPHGTPRASRGHSPEVPHLVPTEVEDERAPVRMRPAAWVGVLVERRPVEAGERPLVAGKWAAHSRGGRRSRSHASRRRTRAGRPGRRASPAGEVARHLVAPRARRDAASRACSSTWVNPSSTTCSESSSARSRQPRPWRQEPACTS